MANRTFNRQPFSVPVPRTRDGFFNHVLFKGLCDNKNDTTVDQQTFSDINNMYVDDANILTSRPPLKFFDGEAYIVDQWLFGDIGLRLHRLLTTAVYADTGEPVLDEFGLPVKFFAFILRCITQDTADSPSQGIYGEKEWLIPVDAIGYDFIPKVKHVQIEDKIFTWFGGIDFVCFNTAGIFLSSAGKTYPYFENAIKYLYFPIHKLVINGIESDLETKNFLTETYKKRYQYSAISSVNFEKLIGRQVSINLNGRETQNKSKHLYDLTVQKNQDKMLIYPYSPIGSNYHTEVIQTQRATVVMRYSVASHIIDISFDGKFFRPLPILEDIVGNPQLTKDGMWVVAFTQKGLAKCKIVAQETLDFIETEHIFNWIVDPYMRNVLINGFPGFIEELDTSFMPVGHFETIDQFAYVFMGPSIYSNLTGTVQYVYAEWLSGSNDVMWGHNTLIDVGTNSYIHMLLNDDIKIHFRYTAPTLNHQDLAGVVSIMTPVLQVFEDDGTTITQIKNCTYNLFFTRSEQNINRVLYNDDVLFITDILGNPRNESLSGNQGFVHKLNFSGKDIVIEENRIYANDIIAFTPIPMNVSVSDDFSTTISYVIDDVVTYQQKVYRCIRESTGPLPTNTTYWKALGYDSYVNFKYSVDGTEYTSKFSWKMAYLLLYRGIRFRIEKLDGSIGAVKPNDRIRITTQEADISYSGVELQNIFGNFPRGTGDTVTTWESWTQSGPWVVSRPSPSKIFTGNSIIIGVNDTASISRSRIFGMGINIDVEGDIYNTIGFGASCRQMDINILTPKIDAETLKYNLVAGYSVIGENSTGVRKNFDCFLNIEYDYVTDTFIREEALNIVLGNSQWFKILPNSKTVLTDLYLWIDDEILALPQNGELFPLIEDNERLVVNTDNLILALRDVEDNVMVYDGNVHKLTSDGINLSTGQIQSGDLVSYTKGAVTEQDYLQSGLTSNRFIIQKLAVSKDGNWVVVNGGIKSGDLIRLLAYNKTIILPVGNPGNPYKNPITIQPWVYPTAPIGWKIGDPWPESFPTYPPITADSEGNILFWKAGDALPIGPVQMFGITNLNKRVRPLSIDSTGVWYNIDGTLWTSQLSTENIVELDEYINAELQENKDGTRTRIINFRSDVPDYSATLNEHYLSFVTRQEGYNLLQVTATRRDEDKLFTDEGRDFLFYLPKINEQKFSKKITNLHTLSDNEMGIFTQDEIWYIQAIKMDNLIVYTAPIKSKIPIGCRDGSDIITALDGKLIVFTSIRGVTALSPQELVATTEQTISYLSNDIQQKYQGFYNDPVYNAMFMPNEMSITYRPIIKIVTYKYWIIFYRYMDREILVFDTRMSSWWVWSTPYPIRSMMVGTKLHILMQIDFSPLKDNAIWMPPQTPTMLGVSFVLADFKNDTTYYDDIIENAIDGRIEWIPFKNGKRRQVYYPNKIIYWWLTSQLIHFDEINNYKSIKALNLVAKGDTIQTAKISTKVYRDFYHPETSEVTEIKINDIRTFIQRLNLMRVINFQYKIEADLLNEEQTQIRLNSLSIKYEIKERIR